MDIVFHPIGVIHTPFQTTENMPVQSSRTDAVGEIEVFPEYQEGLIDIDSFSHLILLYHFHRAPREFSLKVKPFLDDRLHGIFTTRYPHRPNLIGLSIVEVSRWTDNRIEFIGADMLDGTPLIDIKPYVPEFDFRDATKVGWYQHRAFK